MSAFAKSRHSRNKLRGSRKTASGRSLRNLIRSLDQAKTLEEIIVSISRMSGLPAAEIDRLFMSSWSSPVAVILKAIGFHLTTVDAIYRSRLSSGEVIHNDLFQAKAEFIALRRPTAERIMRFYCARKAAKLSDLA